MRNLKSKDSLDTGHNLKRFSFGNNRGSSVKPKSRAASRYQDPTTEIKTREVMWSFDLGGQSSTKDIIISELDVFSSYNKNGSEKNPASFQSLGPLTSLTNLPVGMLATTNGTPAKKETEKLKRMMKKRKALKEYRISFYK